MTGQLLMVVGKPTSGKTFSLSGLENQEKVLYLNCEGSGKPLPFRNKFIKQIVAEPYPELLGESSFFQQAINSNGKIETIVIDTLTFLMRTVETKYVKTADPKYTMQAWGSYGDFYINLLSQVGKLITKGINVIVTSHVADRVNENDMVMESYIPIKGAVGKTGAEADFSDIVSTKTVKIKDLEPYQNELLHITDDERELGCKHVIQTRLTKDTVGERIRTNGDMWKREETFIDGNIQLVLNRMREFYGE